jgi:hypothetical protein
MSKYKRLHVTTKHVDEWYAEPFGYPMLVDSDGKVVGMCLSSDAGYDHLFAAAPEMLEALEKIKETGVFLGAIAQEMMELAIAKAKGEQL